MTLVPVDQIDARLEDFCEGIGATTEHHGMTALEWRDYARALEADNKRLVALGNKLNGKLLDAQAARGRLNAAAETKAAHLKGKVKIWRAATYSLAVVFIGVIGGLLMGLSR